MLLFIFDRTKLSAVWHSVFKLFCAVLCYATFWTVNTICHQQTAHQLFQIVICLRLKTGAQASACNSTKKAQLRLLHSNCNPKHHNMPALSSETQFGWLHVHYVSHNCCTSYHHYQDDQKLDIPTYSPDPHVFCTLHVTSSFFSRLYISIVIKTRLFWIFCFNKRALTHSIWFVQMQTSKHTHTHTHTHMHTRMHTCMHTRMHAHTHARMLAHKHAHTHIYIHTYI